MTYAFFICIVGLILWLIFTKWQKVADSWVAEVGKICFTVGLLAWLLLVGGKSLF